MVQIWGGRSRPLYLTKYETSFSVREHIHVFSLLDSYTLKSNLSLVFWWRAAIVTYVHMKIIL